MGWLLVLPPLFHHSAGLAVSGGSVSGRRTAGGGAWRAVNTIKSFLQGRCSASWRMRPRTGSLIGWLRMVAVVALEEHALPGRPGSMSQARAAAPDQTGGDLLIFRLGREGGAGDLGDIGVRGSARVLVPQSVLGYSIRVQASSPMRATASLTEAFIRTVTVKRAPSDRQALITSPARNTETGGVTGRPAGAAGPDGAGRLVMNATAARAELAGYAVRRRVAAITGADSSGAVGGCCGRSHGRGPAAGTAAWVFPGIRPARPRLPWVAG
jgi:hypothetical protein